MKKLKNITWVVGLLAVTDFAFAHSQPGSLGKSTTGGSATDVYQINCYDDDSGAGVPNKILVHVKDNLSKLPSVLSVQVVKGGSATVPVADPVDGDANYSPWATLTKGAGTYTVLVNKSVSSIKGAENYTLEYHCQSASGNHAGTDTSLSQNQ